MIARGLLRGVVVAGAIVSAADAVDAAEEAAFARARESARVAGYSLSKVQRWLHEKCLPAIDKATGLYRWQSGKEWSYRVAPRSSGLAPCPRGCYNQIGSTRLDSPAA